MKFTDIPYKRPDLTRIKKDYQAALDALENASSSTEAMAKIMAYYALQDALDTAHTLVEIRQSIDTTDAFYDAEKTFFDAEMPAMQAYDKRFSTLLLTSPYQEELNAHFGPLLFQQLALSEKTFDDRIIEDLQKENKLVTEYGKLMASAALEFDGKILNLSQMAPYTQNKDREVRKAAHEKVSAFFAGHLDTFDRLYDELVKVRVLMAKKLGFDSFIDLAYARLGRTDYTASEVTTYRDQIYTSIVPVVQTLMDRKASRLGIQDLKYYDLALNFLSGNPAPKGDRAWQVNHALDMYHAMHPKTGAFFQMMVDDGYMDLDSKPGKEGGGYCTFIAAEKKPFIFANFNGTSHDVDVLTHEAGHAFQAYMSQEHIAPYRWPTLESAEIHSMSMEFLAWPYIDKFFEDDTAKYQFTHLSGALSFLPYGAAVDEFQHGVYKNPDLTPGERRALWRQTEKKYMPYKHYDGEEFLENGGFWFRQGHIFSVPFYYIDYTLAQVVAFQYFGRSQKDYQAALDSYVALCELGGSQSFTGLLASQNLDNPFKAGRVAKIAAPIKAYLDGIQDSELK